MYGMFSFRRERERERIRALECIEKRHTILLLWNKKRTNGGKVFLISRAHDKLLLMSDEEKKEAIFVKCVCE